MTCMAPAFIDDDYSTPSIHQDMSHNEYQEFKQRFLYGADTLKKMAPPPPVVKPVTSPAPLTKTPDRRLLLI